MKDIEAYIRENRELFDNHQPGDRVWKNLQEEFGAGASKKSKLKRIPILRWAAAAAVILWISAGIYYFSEKTEMETQTASEIGNEIPSEYAEEVYHFTKLIELKHKELSKLKKAEPVLYQRFSADITKLDSSYQMLKKALPGNPNEEMVLAAMVENLRIQIDLLNEQLQIIKKIRETKNNSHEKLYKSS